MRNLEEARKEAREIIKEDYDLVLGEVEELHNLDEWRKITTAFDLGVTAGAKSRAVPDEAELMELMNKLSPDQLFEVMKYAKELLLETAAEKVTVCRSCGSTELSRDGRFITCDKCGAGGFVKVPDSGKVSVIWEDYHDPEDE